MTMKGAQSKAMMTGKAVWKAAKLIRRWQRLHRLRTIVVNNESGIIEIARALVSDTENPIIADTALLAMRQAADAEIERLIQCIHGEAADLGVTPPFPTQRLSDHHSQEHCDVIQLPRGAAKSLHRRWAGDVSGVR